MWWYVYVCNNVPKTTFLADIASTIKTVVLASWAKASCFFWPYFRDCKVNRLVGPPIWSTMKYFNNIDGLQCFFCKYITGPKRMKPTCFPVTFHLTTMRPQFTPVHRWKSNLTFMLPAGWNLSTVDTAPVSRLPPLNSIFQDWTPGWFDKAVLFQRLLQMWPSFSWIWKTQLVYSPLYAVVIHSDSPHWLRKASKYNVAWLFF